MFEYVDHCNLYHDSLQNLTIHQNSKNKNKKKKDKYKNLYQHQSKF